MDNSVKDPSEYTSKQLKSSEFYRNGEQRTITTQFKLSMHSIEYNPENVRKVQYYSIPDPLSFGNHYTLSATIIALSGKFAQLAVPIPNSLVAEAGVYFLCILADIWPDANPPAYPY
uniref:Calpain_III domain-containing protein n=1 Tax=Angiostrongylus cantonensis TaxID=6313 RepID=A0A0K0DDS2_ANGCA